MRMTIPKFQTGDTVEMSFDNVSHNMEFVPSPMKGQIGESLGDGWFSVTWQDGHIGSTTLDNPFITKISDNDSGI